MDVSTGNGGSANSTARVAYVEYPAEVDELIADRQSNNELSFAAAAGCAVVASARLDRAFLFSIPAGSSSYPIPIALPQPVSQSNSYSTTEQPPSMALSMWLAEKTSSSTAKTIGIAILSLDAVLRIYPRVPVEDSNAPGNFPCLELRVDDALSRSIDEEEPCSALHVSKLDSSNSELIIFGSRGSAAIVSFTNRDSTVRPLPRDQSSSRNDRSSSRFGSIFYSAIKTIGAGLSSNRDNDWHYGTGPYAIVDSHHCEDGIVLVRRGGEVERWNSNGRLWSFNAFNSTTQNSSHNSIVSSASTSEGTLILLGELETDQGPDRLLQCYDIRAVSEPPPTYHMSIPVDGAPGPERSSFGIVVCSDIVFLFNPDLGRLAWRSVARGVPSEGQVQGSLDVNEVGEIFFLADVSRGLHSSSTSGVAACLHQDGMMISCFQVPAPVSEDILAVSSERLTISDYFSIVWRSFLQYNAGQNGAARASLQGLVNMLVSRDFDTSEALSQLFLLVSRDILCKDVQTFSDDRKTLLIDSALVQKIQLHRVFLKMLSDVQLFTQVRPDAPSIAEDRIWDALDLSTRFNVMNDNEMLAAAYSIRQVENAESVRDLNGGFNEATSNLSLRTGKVVEIARALRASLISENENLREDLNTVSMALTKVGTEFTDSTSRKDSHTELYRNAHEFYKFIPALNVCMSETLQRLSYEHNVPDEENIDNRSMYLEEARSVVSLSCEASISFLDSAMEARAENSVPLSHGSVGLVGIRNWLLEANKSVSALQSIAKKSMIIGLRSSDRERESIMGLATLVVDKLLASVRQVEGNMNHDSLLRPNTDRAQQKRRRVDISDINSEWRRLLRSCMKLLRDHELDEEAFRLAEKYGDFETMMTLKVDADDFNPFMQKSINSFGSEFAKFAFHWLEDRGCVELLLRGRTEFGENGAEKRSCCESEPLKGLLSDYFNTDKKNSTNLAWMHWLATGDVRKGGAAVEKQMKRCAKPGKPGSGGNTNFLSSIAKLTALCAIEEGQQPEEEDIKRFEQVSARLELLSVQEHAFNDKENVRSGTEIVQGLVDLCSTDSEELGSRTATAIGAIGLCELIDDEGSEQKVYVWRRCIERQSDDWISLAKTVEKYTDVEIREKLMQTALFLAGKEGGLSMIDIDEMLKHGLLEGSAVDSGGVLPQVSDLVRTAVSLGTGRS